MSRTTVLVGSFLILVAALGFGADTRSSAANLTAEQVIEKNLAAHGWAAGVAGSPNPVYARQVTGADLLSGIQDGERLDDTLRHGDESARSQATREDRD